MGSRELLFIALGLLVLVQLSTTNVVVYGQATQSGPSARLPPCDHFASLGRPTLKRRGQAAVTTSTVVQEHQVPIKCKSPEDGTVQELVGLRFVGLRSFHETEAFSFIQAKVDLRPDRMPDAETAERAAEALKKLLSTKGYVFADVNVIRDEQFNSVTFQVTEGERLPLADIRFKGTKVFSDAEFKTVTKSCLSRSGDSDSEGAYDQELLEYCLRNAANFIRSRGYLQAKFGEHKSEISGNRIVVTVAVDEGLLYRLGKITIEGADHLPAEDIRKMLPLSQGEVVDAEGISKWLFEDLRKVYADRGYIEYTADPEPDFRKVSAVEGVVDFRVFIEEGERFTLRSIEFEGEGLPTPEFINQSPLQPGDFYNASAFAAFVDQLNQTSLYEPIDKDKDSDFRVNNEERLVSIQIKLRRRRQP